MMTIRVKRVHMRRKRAQAATAAIPTKSAAKKHKAAEFLDINGSDSGSDYSDADLFGDAMSDSGSDEDAGQEKCYEVNGKVLRIKHDQAAAATKDLGAMIWPSSIVVCRYFELEIRLKLKNKLLKGKHILEIGAGVGLAGLACAMMGATVRLTDSEKEVLEFLDENVALNKLGTLTQTAVLNWGDKKNHRPQKKAYDYIILADLLYPETGAANGLVDTLLAHTSKATEIIMAYQHRGCDKCLAFFDQMEAANFDVQKIELPKAVRSEIDSRSCKVVQLFKLRKK
jgi:predicted nicotinamide N-methyase